jgi:hypothetical protein
MSAPKLIVKFRIKEKVPFSIETFSGKIFRCGICGKIYYYREELDSHIEKEKNKNYSDLQFPELERSITINVLYTQDLREILISKSPRLRKGDKLFKKEQ